MSDRGNNLERSSPRSTATSGDQLFDPKSLIERLRRGEVDPQQRVDLLVFWMRKEHPEAQIMTDLAQFSETMAVVKATIGLPSGAEASGDGSAVAAYGPEMVERAETKAIGRALNALGYSVESVEGVAEPPRAPTQESRRAATNPPPAPVAAIPEPDVTTDEEPEPEPVRLRTASPAPPSVSQPEE